MAYHLKKRCFKRIPVAMDAELITYSATYAALIENISERSIRVKIAHHKAVEHLISRMHCYLKFHLPSGQMIHLKCRKIWSDKNTPHSLIEYVAVELIDPPSEYQKFLRELCYSNS